MAINYDLSGLDITDYAEWWERTEFGDYSNHQYFESFVFRMMVLKPTRSGTIGVEEAKRAIIRNAAYEKCCGGIKIPATFIKRMIGLKTNIFPLSTDVEFRKTLMDIVMSDALDMTREDVKF